MMIRIFLVVLIMVGGLFGQSASVTGGASVTGAISVTKGPAVQVGEDPPVAGVTVTQLTSDSDDQTPGDDDGAALAYYDTLGYNGSKIFFGQGEQLTASAFYWKPHTMNLDGTGDEKLSDVRIFDPFGWTPNGDRIYFRKNGLAIMNPSGGTSGNRPWSTVIANVVSGGLCQIGSNLYAVYENPSVVNTIGVWKSTDSGDTFSVYDSYVLDDAYPTYSFHRLRPSCVDLDDDGDPDLFYYKKSAGNGLGSYVFNANTGVSTPFVWDDPANGEDAVGEISHPDVYPDESTVIGGFLSNCGGSGGCGYIQVFSLLNGIARDSLSLDQWSNWNYRAGAVHSETSQVALSKSTGGSEVGLYDRYRQSLLFAYTWPNEPIVPYWGEVAAQMAQTNTIIMRAPDANGVPQLWRVDWRTTYYVSESGDDGDDGLTPATAWQTVSQVNGSSFTAGDTVLFERGGRWDETLDPPDAGVIFSSYGPITDALPIISGADPVTGLSEGATDVFTATVSTEPTQVFIDGVRGERVSTSGEVDTYGEWHWATNTLTVFGPGSSVEPVVEASLRDNAVTLSVSNTTIQNLDLARGAAYTVVGAQSGTIIEDCIVRDGFIDNVRATSTSTFSDYTVQDSEIYGAGATGILINEASADARVLRNKVHNNSNLHQSVVGGDAEQQWSTGIKMTADGTANRGAGALIEGNEVYDNEPHSWVSVIGGEGGRGVGIWLDTLNVTTGTKPVVRANWVHDNFGWGIYLEKTTRCVAEYNLTGDNNQSGTFTANLGIQANSGTTSDQNQAFNNTVYGSAWVATLFGGDSANFTNNEFKNNLIVPDSGIHHLYLQGDGGDTADGNDIDYNFYGDTAVFRVNAANATLATIYTDLATWQSASGQDANSQYDDADLVGSGDYHPNSGSPAIDAGVDVSLIQDYEGNVVPQGLGVDIGAFEIE